MRQVALIFFILKAFSAMSQSVNSTLDREYYHRIDRYEIKSGNLVSALFTSVKPYKKRSIVGFLDSLKIRNQIFSSPADQFNYRYLQNDNWEWSATETNRSKKPFLKFLYKKKSDLLYINHPDFDLHVNPVLYLSVGFDSRLTVPTYINTRGVEIRGMLDRKIGFYTFIADNQSILPSYLQDTFSDTGVIPHEGFWKKYGEYGVDFFQARAYIDFNISKHLYVQFGYDRIFIGNGQRSLILSDHAPPYLFLKANAKFWKINYVYQLARLTADAPASPTGSIGNIKYPEKFLAFHHASLNIGKKFNLGIFESVVFSAQDTVGGTFDLNYLNPIIFYRAIEQQFGSRDNVIIGLDFKWNATARLSFYGQWIIDELLVKELFRGRGWWGNKWGVQVGVKYIDALGVPNLDFQLETNSVNPYTYSHHTQYGSYTHYRQPLAHPLGANFYEIMGIIRYQPIPRIHIAGQMVYANIGRDPTGVNWGSDIMKDNARREREFGNSIGQGIPNDLYMVDFTFSYMIRQNVFFDLKQIFRVSNNTIPVYNTNTWATSLALRWNMAQRLYDF